MRGVCKLSHLAFLWFGVCRARGKPARNQRESTPRPCFVQRVQQFSVKKMPLWVTMLCRVKVCSPLQRDKNEGLCARGFTLHFSSFWYIFFEVDSRIFGPKNKAPQRTTKHNRSSRRVVPRIPCSLRASDSKKISRHFSAPLRTNPARGTYITFSHFRVDDYSQVLSTLGWLIEVPSPSNIQSTQQCA